MTGLVRTFLALAAYRSVEMVSDASATLGDTQAIIKVNPLPDKLSASSLVNVLSLHKIDFQKTVEIRADY